MIYFPDKKNKTNYTIVDKRAGEVYWDDSSLWKQDTHYMLSFGMRSNGKTYSCCVRMIAEYWEHKLKGELFQWAYIRRFDTEITAALCNAVFSHVEHDGLGRNRISEITDDLFNTVIYKSKRFYLAKRDENGDIVLDTDPFCYVFSVNNAGSVKGGNYPYIWRAWMDEFIPIHGDNLGHLVNEYELFENTISTIKREKTWQDGFRVIMTANAINPEDLYFREMGLYHVRDQEMGTIELYKMGDSELTIAVEYTPPRINIDGKISQDPFFAFDNPRLKMITAGDWAIDLFPHLPYKFKSYEVLGRFFIIYNDIILENKIIQHENDLFIYCSKRDMPIARDDADLIYAPAYDPRPNWRRKITLPFTDPEKKILTLIKMDRVYFEDNSVGNIFSLYLDWCKKS